MLWTMLPPATPRHGAFLDEWELGFSDVRKHHTASMLKNEAVRRENAARSEFRLAPEIPAPLCTSVPPLYRICPRCQTLMKVAGPPHDWRWYRCQKHGIFRYSSVFTGDNGDSERIAALLPHATYLHLTSQ